MASQPGDGVKRKAKFVLDPMNGSATVVREDDAERMRRWFRASLDAGGTADGVFFKDFLGVLDAHLGLGTSVGTVQTGGSLCRVSSHEGVALEQNCFTALFLCFVLLGESAAYLREKAFETAGKYSPKLCVRQRDRQDRLQQ